jgi:hypothetical protein
LKPKAPEAPAAAKDRDHPQLSRFFRKIPDLSTVSVLDSTMKAKISCVFIGVFEVT